MDIRRNSASVVADKRRAVFSENNRDFVAVPSQGLIDSVVHHLVHEVVESTGARGTDVHSRALTHRLQALKNLNLFGTVGGLNFCGFAHALVVGPATFSTSIYHRYPRDARRSL
jgi:hypothetical protein